MILNNMHLRKLITVSIIEVQKNILQVALKVRESIQNKNDRKAETKKKKKKLKKKKKKERQKLLTLFMPRAQHCTT